MKSIEVCVKQSHPYSHFQSKAIKWFIIYSFVLLTYTTSKKPLQKASLIISFSAIPRLSIPLLQGPGCKGKVGSVNNTNEVSLVEEAS